MFALFGYVGTPTGAGGAADLHARRRCRWSGTFTGAEALRAPFNRYIFNVRASYFDETEKIVEQVRLDRRQEDRGVLPERRLRPGRPEGRRARDDQAQHEDRRPPARSSATPSKVAGRGEGDQRGPARRGGHDRRLQVVRRVHRQMKKAGQRRAVLQRVVRRQQGARRRARQGRRGVAISQVVPFPWRPARAGGQGIPAALGQGRSQGLQLQRASKASSLAKVFVGGPRSARARTSINQLFTMHGTIMLLLFATPLFAGFAKTR